MCINDRLIFLCVATRHTHESYTVTVSGPKNNDESTNGVPQFSGFHDHDQPSPDAMATTAAASKLSTPRRRLFTYETGEEGASEELYTIQKGKKKKHCL